MGGGGGGGIAFLKSFLVMVTHVLLFKQLFHQDLVIVSIQYKSFEVSVVAPIIMVFDHMKGRLSKRLQSGSLFSFLAFWNMSRVV